MQQYGYLNGFVRRTFGANFSSIEADRRQKQDSQSRCRRHLPSSADDALSETVTGRSISSM